MKRTMEVIFVAILKSLVLAAVCTLAIHWLTGGLDEITTPFNPETPNRHINLEGTR